MSMFTSLTILSRHHSPKVATDWSWTLLDSLTRLANCSFLTRVARGPYVYEPCISVFRANISHCRIHDVWKKRTCIAFMCLCYELRQSCGAMKNGQCKCFLPTPKRSYISQPGVNLEMEYDTPFTTTRNILLVLTFTWSRYSIRGSIPL